VIFWPVLSGRRLEWGLSMCKPNLICTAMLVAALVPLLQSPTWCQQDQVQSNRKVITKVEPEYPHLARSMNIAGIVKLEVVVTSSGNVKSVEIKGGHPVLAQSAVSAVSRWKWERGPQETTESVQVDFHPE